MDQDVVHLHLEHRVVQRLLGRFTAQGFVHHDLSRACLARRRTPSPASSCSAGSASTARGRPGCTRSWSRSPPAGSSSASGRRRSSPTAGKRRRRPSTCSKTPCCRRARRTIDPVIQAKLREAAARDIAELLPHLSQRARELAEGARIALAKRAEQEATAMRTILEEQKKRVAETAGEVQRPAAPARLQRRRAAPARIEQAALGQAAPRDRPGAGHRARAHPGDLRGQSPAHRAGRAGLSLAGDGVERHGQRPGTAARIKNGSATSSRSAWSSRRRRWPPRRRSRQEHHPRPHPLPRPASRRSRSRARTTLSPRSRDFPRFCHAGPRLGAGRPGRNGRGRTRSPTRWRSRSPSTTRRSARPTPSPSSTRPGRRPPLAHARSSVSSSASTSTTSPSDRRTTAGRPAPRPASSGSCARRRSRSACSRTARTCGSSTPRAARPRAT